jgi:hypothetical protein
MSEALAPYFKSSKPEADEKRELARCMLQLFFVRQDVYGIETPEGWITEKKPVTIDLIIEHLNGGPCLGAHTINADNKCRWIGLDFDENAKIVVNKAYAQYPKSATLFNETGGRGYHVRIFFNRLISASEAHRLAKELAEGIQGVEFYPKQQAIGVEGFGNFMRLPLGRHRKTGGIGALIFPSSLSEIKPCEPPVPLAFAESAEDCPDRVQDQKGYWNCVAVDGTVGYCMAQLCPKVT